MLYLDTLASYPLLPEVKKALMKAFEEQYANPSASHVLAEAAKHHVELVREQIAESIGALPSEIVFTSGATESNNLILKSYASLVTSADKKPHIITSKIEHKCVLAICNYLESNGCEVTYLSPSSDGTISAASLAEAFQENTVLVSLMHVNNELGTVNPIKEFGQMCFERQVLFHSDAAQGFQKVSIDVDDDNIDFLSISAHKIGGPKGIGAAYIRNLRNLNIEPVIHGAGQEFGLRGGTLPAPLIIGFGEALKHFVKYYQNADFRNLKRHFLSELKSTGVKFCVNGGEKSLDSCVSLSLDNIDVEGLIRSTSNKFCLSQSSACSAGSIEPSHVLTALGFNRDKASKTLRISFPLSITESELSTLSTLISKFII